MKRFIVTTVKICTPFLLGAGILYWMYRDFSWNEISYVLFHEMKWGWMLLSLVFGVLPQVIRGWRWRLALEPLNEHPRNRTCVYAIFLSYASSLVVPRIGEITRCGTLAKYEGTSFSKAFGTVVTERIVDSVLMLLLTGTVILVQMGVFVHFLHTTGTDVDSILGRFTATGYLVTFLCLVAVVILAFVLVWKLTIFSRVKGMILNVWSGIASLRKVHNQPLYLFYSVSIWICYFLHFYLTFYCFSFTEHLGPQVALVVFSIGSYAVLVPTPNGAGPWHFAVKTMLVLYGVAANEAILFALVVHTIQTALVVVLGIYGSAFLAWTKVRKPANAKIQV